MNISETELIDQFRKLGASVSILYSPRLDSIVKVQIAYVPTGKQQTTVIEIEAPTLVTALEEAQNQIFGAQV
jgi:hypothetical protein